MNEKKLYHVCGGCNHELKEEEIAARVLCSPSNGYEGTFRCYCRDCWNLKAQIRKATRTAETKRKVLSLFRFVPENQSHQNMARLLNVKSQLNLEFSAKNREPWFFPEIGKNYSKQKEQTRTFERVYGNFKRFEIILDFPKIGNAENVKKLTCCGLKNIRIDETTVFAEIENFIPEKLVWSEFAIEKAWNGKNIKGSAEYLNDSFEHYRATCQEIRSNTVFYKNHPNEKAIREEYEKEISRKRK